PQETDIVLDMLDDVEEHQCFDGLSELLLEVSCVRCNGHTVASIVDDVRTTNIDAPDVEPCILQCTHNDAPPAPAFKDGLIWAAITRRSGFFQSAAHQIVSGKRPEIVLDLGRVVVAETQSVERRLRISEVLSRTHGPARASIFRAVRRREIEDLLHVFLRSWPRVVSESESSDKPM